jgi:isopenicillin N synthase-like dioxygenase
VFFTFDKKGVNLKEKSLSNRLAKTSHKTINMNKLVTRFRKNGYFKYGLEPCFMKDSNSLASSWKLFCSQSLRHKEKHIFGQNGGYEYKDENSQDHKENFHLTLDYSTSFKVNTLADIVFIDKGKKFIHKSFTVISEIVQIMSDTIEVDLTDIVCNDISRWVLRFLYYPPQKREYLAISHIDKCITAHWYEDAPGLQIFWNGTWHNVQHKENCVHGYFGLLGQYYSRSNFPALCHRVISSKETRERGRNSIVMFSDFGNVRYNKDFFGPTQKVFPTGENYNMSFEELKKYFVQM